MTCACITVKEATERSLSGLPIPLCEEHEEPGSGSATAAVALNDDAGLLAALSRALDTDLTLTTNIEGA